jgi:hypothetical protein
VPSNHSRLVFKRGAHSILTAFLMHVNILRQEIKSFLGSKGLEHRCGFYITPFTVPGGKYRPKKLVYATTNDFEERC